MRLDNEKPSENVEDRRGQGGAGGGFGFPGGGGRQINIPMGGGRGGMSISTLILLVVVYFAIKLFFGIDLLEVLNGGGTQAPGGSTNTEMTIPSGNTGVADSGTTVGGATSTDVTGDAGKEFVARVLGSTERVWGSVFQQMGQTYENPKLVLFNGFVQSACGMAQSAMGPFYCPGDHKVYIDLSFYQDLKNKLGAPGDAAQGYVIAHEVGHHLQNLFGIAEKVTAKRARATPEESNALSVRMELQADCFAGIWANEAKVFEDGDIEEVMNAAKAIGDDRLQKRSQGYVVPDSFTHGTSEQRARWFKTGFGATKIEQCDTFSTDQL